MLVQNSEDMLATRNGQESDYDNIGAQSIMSFGVKERNSFDR